MARNPYRIDLSAQHAECEANYARLSRLLSSLGDADRGTVGLPQGRGLEIAITERCPYTTTVEIACAAGPGNWVAMPPLTIRKYHDARMAEVIACAGRRHPQPRYEYPNQSMFQPDEKEQWNRFLGEWLSYCLQFGHAARSAPAPSC